jgi:hypothetical protein
MADPPSVSVPVEVADRRPSEGGESVGGRPVVEDPPKVERKESKWARSLWERRAMIERFEGLVNCWRYACGEERSSRGARWIGRKRLAHVILPFS